MEATREIKKEKAMKARRPVRESPGMVNQYEEKPLKTKSKSLKPGTIKVTK